MKPRLKTPAPSSTPLQPAQTLLWDDLPAEQRQALIIALAAMMVKLLAERPRPQEVDDA
jgi:hypothetical protein